MGPQSSWSRVFSLFGQLDLNGDGTPVKLESSFLIVWSIRLEWRWDPSQAGVEFSNDELLSSLFNLIESLHKFTS